MFKKLDNLVGLKFGRLLVLKKEKSINSRARWLCRCDCGTEKIFLGGNLKQGVKSCGCSRKESNRAIARNRAYKELGEAGFKRLLSGYKYNAKIRSIEWNLTEIEFKKLTKQNCYYCNIEPNQIQKSRTDDNGNYTYNGVDRYDNDKDYNILNCVSCCGKCNRAKMNMNANEFIKMCLDVSVCHKEPGYQGR